MLKLWKQLMKQEVRSNKKRKEGNDSWFKSMSKFEKYFWITIIFLLLIFIILNILAFLNTKVEEDFTQKNTSIIEQFLFETISSDQVKNNLNNSKEKINKNLNKELKFIYKTIDDEIDSVFNSVIDNNLESFLNFHYSVIGEYSELGAMASGKIGKTIEKRLLGSDFTKKITSSTENIGTAYNNSVQNHLLHIHQLAIQDVDMKLNSSTITAINDDIKRNMGLQGSKIGAILVARIMPKIAKVIVVKLSSKAAAKIVAKTSAKSAAKLAAAGGGGLAGGWCGPAAIVCSPVLALGAWLAVDVAIVSGDEYFNRDEFRSEIIKLLNQQRDVLKQEYKSLYFKSFSEFSKSVQEQYKNMPIKERKKLKDIIFDSRNKEALNL